jgi:hypothetical protein
MGRSRSLVWQSLHVLAKASDAHARAQNRTYAREQAASQREYERQRAAQLRMQERMQAKDLRERERAQVRDEREQAAENKRRAREQAAEAVQRDKERQLEEWRMEVRTYEAYVSALTGLHRQQVPLAAWRQAYQAHEQPWTFKPVPWSDAPVSLPWTERPFHAQALPTRQPFAPQPFVPLSFLSSSPWKQLNGVALLVGAGLAFLAMEVPTVPPAMLLGLFAALYVGLLFRAVQTHSRQEQQRKSALLASESTRAREFGQAQAEAERLHVEKERERRVRHDSDEETRRATFDAEQVERARINALRKVLHSAQERENRREFESLDQQRRELLSEAREEGGESLGALCDALLPLSASLEGADLHAAASLDECDVGYVAEGKRLRLVLSLPGLGMVPTHATELNPAGNRLRYRELSSKARSQLYDAFVCSAAFWHAQQVLRACPFVETIEIECSTEMLDDATGRDAERILLHMLVTPEKLASLAFEQVDPIAALQNFTHTHQPVGRKAKLSPKIDRDALTWATAGAKPGDEGLLASALLPDPVPFPTATNPFSLPNAVALGDAQPLRVGPAGDGLSLAAALRQARPGSVIHLLPGRYEEAVELTVPVQLVGEGPSDQIVISLQERGLQLRAAWVGMEGLTLEGQSSTTAVVEVERGEASLLDCHVRTRGMVGICALGPAARIRLERCSIQGANHSGLLAASGELDAQNCQVIGSEGSGATVSAGATLRLSECTLRGHAKGGVLASGTLVVENCLIEENGELGIYVDEDATASVSSSRIVHNRGPAIYLGGEATVTACDLQGNAEGSWRVTGPGLRLTQSGNQESAPAAALPPAPEPPPEPRPEPRPARTSKSPRTKLSSPAQTSGPMVLSSGTLVGNYLIERRLGGGGMGDVYLVSHQVLGSKHALKVLKPEFVAVAELRTRFLNEGRLQAQWRHDNIVPVTDLIAEPGIAALVADYVSGDPLDGVIARSPTPLEPAQVREIFQQVLHGMAFVHEQGVVHRDIKPSNIMISPTPQGRLRARILDFGIAKLSNEPGANQTVFGTKMGTLNYMSPEQIRDASSVDLRSDIFSLGATLYELATRCVAFDAPNAFDLQTKITQGTFAAPQTIHSGLDPRIAAAIRTALEVDPSRRFQSCESFLHALDT